MDPLTQFVDLLRPRALLWKHMVGEDDWAWRMPADTGIVFGRVVYGSCRFQLPGEDEHMLEAGDYMLLTAPPSWVLRAGDERAAITDFEELSTDRAAADRHRGTANHVRVVGGHFELDSVNTELLTGFLAPVVHITASSHPDHGRLSGVLNLIDVEASSARAGQQAVLSRLSEILLIELLRAPELLSGRRGMLTGLSDPQIASALRAFHADIRGPWSVAALAAEAAMSRSVFSQRFLALVGEPPMTYVVNWRMAVARDALRLRRWSLDQTASATGYGSTSAFSTAFTRTVGQSPARFAREE